MNRSDIVTELALLHGLPRKEAEQIVKAIFEEMTLALQNDERVEFRGFGTFTSREYGGYDGRNPKTGEAVPVSSKKRVRFRMSEVLFEKMNRSFEEGTASK